MLSFLCHSPRPEDFDYDGPQATRVPRRMSLSTSPRKKKRIEKLSIGAPTDFKHERHIGSDLVVPAEMFEADKWRREVHRNHPTLTARPQSLAPPPAPPALAPPRRASLPFDSSQAQQQDRLESPSAPVKRKPIPAYLDETASVSPFPTIAPRPQLQQQQQQSAAQRQKELVRLLDTLPEGRDAEDPLLVTKTTKARFDGAMREIAQALRDP
ncbi:hypothetical protein AURDEDRAFT_112720 [Auricularia subglabra TFB-10046 SS5]|nr:hypothetical protein AURDEDRAFT_112720 [Auricularia subglabra TFB-10046 SS5]